MDKDKQADLRSDILAQEAQLTHDLQDMIPDELHPRKIYKGWSQELRKAIIPEKKTKPSDYADRYEFVSMGYRVEDDVVVKLLPFNPGSSPQLLSYIEYKGYKVPLHIETGKPTTGKNELEKLVASTGDPALKLVGKIKKLTKLLDYCGGSDGDGAWVPEEDGRVYATFRFGSATGQTTATDPPIQTYPKHYDPDDLWIKAIMDRVKGCIVAPPGYVMVEIDMTGFHGRMQGFLAEDADYYRLAAIDLHSFNTALYVNEPDVDIMLELSDGELAGRLSTVKAEHKYVRDYMVKRVSFLNQYGGGAEKASNILGAPRADIQLLMDKMAKRFPKTLKEYPAKVAKQLRRSPQLRTAFNCIRWIWDQDILQGVAFGPSNSAHSHIQLALLRLYDRGALEKYGAVNFMHDSLWYCCPIDLALECIRVTREEFERPSEILVNSLGPFTCGSDASMGSDMAHMEKVK